MSTSLTVGIVCFVLSLSEFFGYTRVIETCVKHVIVSASAVDKRAAYWSSLFVTGTQECVVFSFLGALFIIAAGAIYDPYGIIPQEVLFAYLLVLLPGVTLVSAQLVLAAIIVPAAVLKRALLLLSVRGAVTTVSLLLGLLSLAIELHVLD